MPAPGRNGTNYHRRRRSHQRQGKPLLGDFTSPKSEAAAMLELLEHGSTAAAVRELISFPPKARRELLAAGVPFSLVQRSAEYRARILAAFEEMNEKRKKKARRAVRKVRQRQHENAAHAATVARLRSQLPAA